MTTTADIDQMLGRIALGDRTAFAALYEATSGKLFGVAMRVLSDKDAASDALQETYMKVWRYADRYSSNGMSPLTWLTTIARNTAIDRLRATRKDADLATLEGRGQLEEKALSQEDQINACLSTLPDDRKRAILSAYLEGASYAELAQRFDVPTTTMRSWMRRALLSLRECMTQ